MIGSHLVYTLTKKSEKTKKSENLLDYNIYFHLPFIWNLHEDINVLNIPDIII